MSVYTTEAALTLRIGTGRLTMLLDRDRDDSADSGVLDAAIARASDQVNRRLKQRYGSSIPFADMTDDPATPGEIQEIAERLVLAELYELIDPLSNDAVHYRDSGDKALERLRTGEDDIAGISRALAHEGAVVAVYSNEDPVFAGTDTSSLSRTRGL